MNFSRNYLLGAVAGIVSLWATLSSASAQTATFTYNDGTGTPNAGDYNPGDPLNFSVTLNFTSGGNMANVAGFSYWFEQQNSIGPYYFTLTKRDATGSPFNFLQTSGTNFSENLDPSNNSDLGASTSDLSGKPSGSYFVANLSFSISASAAPGFYVIENTTTGGQTSAAFDDTGQHSVNIPQSIYTIHVVPEPGTLALFVTGFALSAVAIWRRRREQFRA